MRQDHRAVAFHHAEAQLDCGTYVLAAGVAAGPLDAGQRGRVRWRQLQLTETARILLPRNSVTVLLRAAPAVGRNFQGFWRGIDCIGRPHVPGPVERAITKPLGCAEWVRSVAPAVLLVQDVARLAPPAEPGDVRGERQRCLGAPYRHLVLLLRLPERQVVANLQHQRALAAGATPQPGGADQRVAGLQRDLRGRGFVRLAPERPAVRPRGEAHHRRPIQRPEARELVLEVVHRRNERRAEMRAPHRGRLGRRCAAVVELERELLEADAVGERGGQGHPRAELVQRRDAQQLPPERAGAELHVRGVRDEPARRAEPLRHALDGGARLAGGGGGRERPRELGAGRRRRRVAAQHARAVDVQRPHDGAEGIGVRGQRVFEGAGVAEGERLPDGRGRVVGPDALLAVRLLRVADRVDRERPLRRVVAAHHQRRKGGGHHESC